ncbi:hypothetical protein PRZ48_014484 [Zasmidium cellare]|uniref:Uncharacterized protein n=1 Tax=Zasmidium cellare TaxID=395010 RepID=A0ABR0DZ20_ZASCE|nr:hypothetical protein PRZ48_014484 [Zasmidium cellare]
MAAPTPDDELLLILLRNLRNAAATFGEGTPPYEGIRTTVEDHLQSMKKKGLSTNLTAARQQGAAGYSQPPSNAEENEARELTGLLENLTLRTKKTV